jgi:hypothetical protein
VTENHRFASSLELQGSRAKTELPRELLQIVLDSMTDGIALIEADGRRCSPTSICRTSTATS